jgi:DNA-binding transcriptional LysR family regulator
MAMPGRDHPVLTSVPLVDPVVRRRVGIVRRRGRALTPAAQQFYREIMEMKRSGAGKGESGDGDGDAS